MKTATFVTLLVLCVSIIIPVSVTIIPSASVVFMVADDVCEASDGAFSADTDHPVLQPGRCLVCCPACAGVAEAPGLACLQSAIPAVKDQPPEP